MDVREIVRLAVSGEMAFSELISALRAILRSRPLSLDDYDHTISALSNIRCGVDTILRNRKILALHKVRDDLTKIMEDFKQARANTIFRSIPDVMDRRD
jgi:hypothetical protein